MLTVDDVRNHVRRYGYKPGWAWHVNVDPWEGIYIRFQVDVPDALGDGQTVTLGIDSYLSPNDLASCDALDHWFAWRVCRIESHEAREFLQRDGRPVFDPHASHATS